ncbi:MAG TPA: hypothetical protein DEP87_01570 [Candidatus Pacebacteria bacterium]|nr:hypothetical protein [Candidatus Paceibacterota bacterium]
MKPTPTLSRAIAAYLAKAPMFMAIIRAQEMELFRRFKKYLGQEVLDFGCGDGFFASVAISPLQKFRRLVGIDVIGNSRVKIAPEPYDDLYLYDGRQLPFAIHSFDTVVSNCVFEHIPDMPKSAKEIYRVLKPGGFCVTSVMTQDWEKMLWWRRIFGQTYVNWLRRQQQHVGLRSVAAWQKLFNQTGFEVVTHVGYVGDQCGPWLDLAHYLSWPSLVSYAINRKWVWWPQLQIWLFRNWLQRMINLPAKFYAAEFFILRKPKVIEPEDSGLTKASD